VVAVDEEVEVEDEEEDDEDEDEEVLVVELKSCVEEEVINTPLEVRKAINADEFANACN